MGFSAFEGEQDAAYRENGNRQWVVPQSQIESKYQSNTEKGIRRLCSQLLDMKMASAEELHCNVYSKYSAFLRIAQEILNLENEVKKLEKHIATQESLIKEIRNGFHLEDLMDNACNVGSPEPGDPDEDASLNYSSPSEDPSSNELVNHTDNLSEVLDVLLAEHKADEAMAILDAEEKAFIEFQKAADFSPLEFLKYQSALTEWKTKLAKQFAEVAKQPAVHGPELRKALSALVRLGDGPQALILLLDTYHLRLQTSIQSFLPSSAFFSETYTTTLAQVVFSFISQTAKDFVTIFEDAPEYNPELVCWAEKEIKYFVKLVKRHVPSLDTDAGLRAATMCVEASMSLCSLLEKRGLSLCPYLLELLQPYFEGALETNLKQVEERICSSAASDDWVLTSAVTNTFMDHTIHIQNNGCLVYEVKLTDSAHKFISAVQDIAECMTKLVSSHFGVSILKVLAKFFKRYIETCMKAIPCPHEDEISMAFKDNSQFIWAETEAQQLALLGNASALADELMPLSISRILEQQTGNQEYLSKTSPGTSEYLVSCPLDLRDWRRQLQRSVDKLRDHFCRQYVLGLIYSREGNVQLTGSTYLNGRNEDLFWDSDAMPSSSFQGLFMKLNQLAQLAAIVLVGRDKVVKNLLTRLTETVLIWLLDAHEFWGMIEDESASLSSFGLQQFMLDMHFIIQIAKSGGYFSKTMQQSFLSIKVRAVHVFSAKGIDSNSALPEDEWFVDAANAAICKLRADWSYKNPEVAPASALDVEFAEEHNGEPVIISFSGEEILADVEEEPPKHSDKIFNLEINVASDREIDKFCLEDHDILPGSPLSSVSSDSFASAEMEDDGSSDSYAETES